MAKQQIFQLENGATLIYQKQSVFNGSSFVIGFRSGAQLDGEYKGLSHLIEHLMFRSSNADFSKNILNNLLKSSVGQNAYTSEYCIASSFNATHNNIDLALENNVNLFKNTSFTPEQIAKEVEVVKQEINMYKDMYDDDAAPSASEVLFANLSGKEPQSSTALSGTAKTLKKVTPEIIKKYADRYFNLDNLIVSVTSNKPAQEILELCQKHIFSKFTNASEEKFIVPYPNPNEFKDINLLCAIPSPSQNVSIELIIKERSDYSENVDKEYAFNVIEEYMMNVLGGALYTVLRTNNNLVYSYGLENADFGTAKFKIISALTSSPKMRKTIRELCQFIKNIGENGVSEEQFNTIKNVLVDQQNATLQKFKSCSAMKNFEDYLHDVPYIDYKAVINHIKNITYEDFQNYIISVYSCPNISVAIDGNFDSRKLYNLIEIEQMVGNDAHKEGKDQLNQPIIQCTEIPRQTSFVITPDMFQVQEENIPQMEDAVTIDDEIVR